MPPARLRLEARIHPEEPEDIGEQSTGLFQILEEINADLFAGKERVVLGELAVVKADLLVLPKGFPICSDARRLFIQRPLEVLHRLPIVADEMRKV